MEKIARKTAKYTKLSNNNLVDINWNYMLCRAKICLFKTFFVIMYSCSPCWKSLFYQIYYIKWPDTVTFHFSRFPSYFQKILTQISTRVHYLLEFFAPICSLLSFVMINFTKLLVKLTHITKKWTINPPKLQNLEKFEGKYIIKLDFSTYNVHLRYKIKESDIFIWT